MNRQTATKLFTPLALICGLTACGDDSAPAAAGGEGAAGVAGDVQGGVISDDMLPLESVTSQAPARGGDGEDGGDDTESDDAESADEE